LIAKISWLEGEIIEGLENQWFHPELIPSAISYLFRLDSSRAVSVAEGLIHISTNKLWEVYRQQSAVQEEILLRLVTTIGEAVRIISAERKFGEEEVFIELVDILKKFVLKVLSIRLQASFVLTYCRILSLNQQTTIEEVPFFKQMLRHQSTAVRGNVALVVGDIVEKYPSTGELLDELSERIRDEEVIIRRQVQRLFVSLICKEFVKFKGKVLFRMLYTLADQDSYIRNVAHIFLTSLFAHRGDLIKSIFVGVVCYINNVKDFPGIPIYQEDTAYNLREEDRFVIYEFLLSNLTGETDFIDVRNSILGKILGPFSKQTEGNRAQVFYDALQLLSKSVCPAFIETLDNARPDRRKYKALPCPVEDGSALVFISLLKDSVKLGAIIVSKVRSTLKAVILQAGPKSKQKFAREFPTEYLELGLDS
jgi:non-SMC mitotic condensation complex subunit 1